MNISILSKSIIVIGLLTCFSHGEAESFSNRLESKVSEESMSALKSIAQEQAKQKGLIVDRVEFGATLHPLDIPCVFVHYELITGVDGFYTNTCAVYKNSEWKPMIKNPVISPASTNWVEMNFRTQIAVKATIDGADKLIKVNGNMSADQSIDFIQSFLHWAKKNPDQFHESIGDFTGLTYQEDEAEVRFSFLTGSHSSTVYVFDVSRDLFKRKFKLLRVQCFVS